MSEKTKRRRLSFKEKYKLIKEVKAGAPKKFLLNKYCITDRMYNRVLESSSSGHDCLHFESFKVNLDLV